MAGQIRVEEVAISTLDGDLEPLDLEPLVRALGARVRQLRRGRGLTLAQLAALTGLSHPFLSKVERGLASPSMASLTQIARALGTSQLELLAGADTDLAPDQPATEIRRAGQGATGPYGLGRARLLVGGSRRFQPMEFEGDNLDPGDYNSHAEDEFIYVTFGIVIVDLDMHGTETLTRGDSLYLDGGVPHRWSAAEPGGYRLFIVKEKPQHARAEPTARPRDRARRR